MANGDVYDGLAKAAGGDIGPTAELVGCVFTLLSFETVETKFKDDKGKNKVTQIATLVLEGQEESQRNWLGGVELNRQLPWLEENGHLPVVVKLGGKGNQESPYELVAPNAESSPDAPPAEAKSAKKAVGQKSADPLAHFRNPDGSLNWEGDPKSFVETLERQPEGFTRYGLAAVIGAYSPQALEHWLKVGNRTITDLKKVMLKAREGIPDPRDELPFE
jgi:hypothetical protein